MDKPEVEVEVAAAETVRDLVIRLAKGNPGALNVMVELLHTPIDMDSAFGEAGPIVLMDGFAIKGEDIWKLFSACRRDHAIMVGFLRAVQLGFLPLADLKAIIEDDRAAIPDKAFKTLDLVKAKLPNFKWELASKIVPG